MKMKKTLAAVAATIFAMTSVATLTYAEDNSSQQEASSSSAASSEASSQTSTGTSSETSGSSSESKPEGYIKDKTNTLKIGSGSETIVGGKVTSGGNESNFTASADITANAGDGVNVTLKKNDLKKIKGEAAIIASISSTPEGDNDNVDVEELDFDLKKDVAGELAKVKAEDVVIVNIKVGIGGYLKSSIGCPITVEIPDTFKGAKVYHVNENGSLTIVSSETTQNISDNKWSTTFTTKNFSPFIITKSTLTASAAAESTDSADASNGTTNPGTGISLALAPVALTAVAIGAVVLKKKH